MHKYRLYNVLFPLWFFLFIPSTGFFILTFIGNIIIDTLVLFLGCRLNHQDFKSAWKKCFLWIFGFGYLSDFIGGALLMFISFSVGSSVAYAIQFNPYAHLLGFLITAAITVLSGGLIYLFNLKISFRRLPWTLSEKRKAALLLAILTAPYLFFFLPSFFTGK